MNVPTRANVRMVPKLRKKFCWVACEGGVCVEECVSGELMCGSIEVVHGVAKKIRGYA
jgi:hypothetical protein